MHAVLEPESVGVLEVGELASEQARECRTEQRPATRCLRYSGRPQVDIVHGPDDDETMTSRRCNVLRQQFDYLYRRRQYAYWSYRITMVYHPGTWTF